MRVSGVTNYNYNTKKQVNFGMIKDQKAKEILKKSEDYCSVLEDSKFFVFYTENGQLRAKLNEDFLRERTSDRLVRGLKYEQDLDFENPLNTLRDFRGWAIQLYEYQDTSKPSEFRYAIRAERFKNSEVRDPEKENWDRCMNDLAF